MANLYLSGGVTQIGGGGGGVSGALSGLYLDGANVKLGSNGVNPLLANTNIDLGGFNFTIGDNIDFSFLVMPNHIVRIGDIVGNANRTNFIVDDTIQRIYAFSVTTGIQSMILDFLNDRYSFGAIGGGNGNQLLINDAANYLQLGNFTGGFGYIFTVNPGAGNFTMSNGTNQYFACSPSTFEYYYGDIFNSHNGLVWSIDDRDAFKNFTFRTGGYSSEPTSRLFMIYDTLNSLFQVGDIDGTLHHSYLNVDDGNQSLQFFGGGNLMLDIQATTNTARLGEIASGYILTVDSATGKITATVSALGLAILGDAANLIHTETVLSDYSAGNIATLNNAPAAGDPTKWIQIDDNGTPRWIPTWS